MVPRYMRVNINKEVSTVELTLHGCSGVLFPLSVLKQSRERAVTLEKSDRFAEFLELNNMVRMGMTVAEAECAPARGGNEFG